jgi:hypothetical protein
MNYSASGGISIFGCVGPNNATFTVLTLFSVNDFAWIKFQAKKGILEKINIKKINFIDILSYNYQDTLNRLWLEYELTDLTTAKELIDDFKQQQQTSYAIQLRNCSSVIN